MKHSLCVFHFYFPLEHPIPRTFLYSIISYKYWMTSIFFNFLFNCLTGLFQNIFWVQKMFYSFKSLVFRFSAVIFIWLIEASSFSICTGNLKKFSLSLCCVSYLDGELVFWFVYLSDLTIFFRVLCKLLFKFSINFFSLISAPRKFLCSFNNIICLALSYFYCPSVC